MLADAKWLNLKRMGLRFLSWLRSCACAYILSCLTFVTHSFLWCSSACPLYLLGLFFSFATSPLLCCLYHVGQVAFRFLATMRRLLLY